MSLFPSKRSNWNKFLNGLSVLIFYDGCIARLFHIHDKFYLFEII